MPLSSYTTIPCLDVFFYPSSWSLHLPAFHSTILNPGGAEVSFWKSRIEGEEEEEKKKDVWSERWGAHDENIIDYVRKIYELLMASPPACLSGLGKLLCLSLSHACLSLGHPFVYLQLTILSLQISKRVISKSKRRQDKNVRSLKFIRSLLSCY